MNNAMLWFSVNTILLNKTEFYNEGETKAPISIRAQRSDGHPRNSSRQVRSLDDYEDVSHRNDRARKAALLMQLCIVRLQIHKQHLDQHRGCDETYERINDLLKEINITHLWYFWPMEIIAL